MKKDSNFLKKFNEFLDQLGENTLSLSNKSGNISVSGQGIDFNYISQKQRTYNEIKNQVLLNMINENKKEESSTTLVEDYYKKLSDEDRKQLLKLLENNK